MNSTIEVVGLLNREIYEQVQATSDFYDYLVYSTNGDDETIEFMGWVIYNTNDGRTDDIEAFLRKEVNNMIKNLKLIKL